VATPKIMFPVLNCVATRPFTRTIVCIVSRSTSVSIHGPMGLKVSLFLQRQNVRSICCHVRSLKSFPMV
jgi:hypothetical protein